jgi:hypothetical protein
MKTTLLATTIAAAAALFAFTGTADAGGYSHSSRSCSPSYGNSHGGSYGGSYNNSRSHYSKPSYPYHGSSSYRGGHSNHSYPSYQRSYRPSSGFSFSYNSRSYRPSYRCR